MPTPNHNAVAGGARGGVALSPDRRRSDRRPHIVEAWLIPPPDNTTDTRREVVSMDVSRHGMGFLSPLPLKVGGLFRIEMSLGKQQMSSEIRIVSCRPFEGGEGLYRVGAEFC